MLKPSLMATITALMLVAGTSGLRAEYDLSQLQEIERLVLLKDSGALGRFLALNPQIVSGDDPLARELRSFRNCTQGGQLDCFASPKVVKKVIEAGSGIPTPAAIY